MSGWLLDTNVVSELRKPRPNEKVVTWMRRAGVDRLFMSTISLAEVRFGIELVVDPDQRMQLSSWLDVTIRPMFVGRILEVDEECLFRWRVLGAALNSRKRTVPEPDLLLSAVARRHRLTVATRDVKHIAETGVSTFNPWTGESFNQPA